ncbi:hypothetical protein TPHA_0A00960 [Tetrapisispora phaffii CBS 4417]|uniref:peptidyl-tRNA hydrolase n=1 Tax=Tetrapisispora phaffii (strain ATCC 24235 / CBS 4417 / NBRC 1672 / NRRL Y-8282 / UCD 70-5) TaxID=1071381 RepID=G8BMQ3_TETPH|nr:hypothetical protein TPHA_0A00960 [Tetrapisispora phaffii CBS 4417]CCE61181.1 hypothetical protein TPHA_0A00960 [Tetrapisispora phaffii CBS 4417]
MFRMCFCRLQRVEARPTWPPPGAEKMEVVMAVCISGRLGWGVTVTCESPPSHATPPPSMSKQSLLVLSTAAVSLATGVLIGSMLSKGNTRSHARPPARPPARTPANTTEQVPKAPVLAQSSSESEFETETESDYEIESLQLNDVPGEVRLALVIRQDLQMTKGKIAAQCCHAALQCFRNIAVNSEKISYNPVMTDRWLRNGQAKITLKCPDKELMDELFAKAISLGVNACVIHDAGRTQIEAGSATVLGLGPAPKQVLDLITGDLKLY